MSVESLTYAALADRLGTTQKAARSLTRRLRLPRQTGNDGKVRINIDLAEIQYKPLPARSPVVTRRTSRPSKRVSLLCKSSLGISKLRTVRSARVRPRTDAISSTSATVLIVSRRKPISLCRQRCRLGRLRRD